MMFCMGAASSQLVAHRAKSSKPNLPLNPAVDEVSTLLLPAMLVCGWKAKVHYTFSEHDSTFTCAAA